LNWTMPALVKSRVGSFWGTREEEATRRWPFSSKKRRKASRIWAAERVVMVVGAGGTGAPGTV